MINNLFQRLEPKQVKCKDWQLRVLNYDPVNIPSQFNPQPYNRTQNISITDIFPHVDGICACGCGKKLTGAQRRWASDECKYFAEAIRFIVYGQASMIARYMRMYYGWTCFKCGCNDKGHDMGANGIVSWIKVDHIIPVKNGGGACWLSNYQLLCHDCHVRKTNKDFDWKKEMSSLFTEQNQQP